MPFLGVPGSELRAWLSKQKPLASTEAHVSPLWFSFSQLCQLTSPQENLSFGTSNFDQLIKANQLGPDSLKINLLLGFLSWNILETFLGI